MNPSDACRYAIFQLSGLLKAPRWRNGISLAFPASDVAAWEGNAVTPACIGLLGMAGALPYHYTDAVARANAPAARAFMDLLSAPAVNLFCAAWREARPGDAALPAIPLQRGPLRARALGERLAQGLGVPVRVEQFVGHWEGLPPGQRSALGACSVACGSGVLLGERLWRIDSAVRIHVGPLDGRSAQAFLPGAPAAAALSRLWRGAAGALPAEACIHVHGGGHRAARLGAVARLGYDALLAGAGQRERDDLRYRLC